MYKIFLYCFLLFFLHFTTVNSFSQNRSKTSIDTAQANKLLTIGWNLRKNYPDSALKLAEQASKFIGGNKTLFQKQQSLKLRCYNNLGLLHQEGEDTIKALVNFSLGYELRHEANDDTALLILCNNLGRFFRNRNDFKQSIKYYENYRVISEKIHDQKSIENAYFTLGVLYLNIGENHSALTYLNKSIELGKEIRDSIALTYSYLNLGVAYKNLSAFVYAEKNFLTALSIAENHSASKSDYNLIGDIYHHLGTLYSYFGEKEKSKIHYEKALNAFRASQNKDMLARVYSSMGDVYSDLEDVKTALAHYKKSMELLKETKDRNGIGVNLVNIGVLFNEYYYYDTALTYFDFAYEIFIETGNRIGEARVLRNIGKSEYFKKNYINALTAFQESYRIYDSLGNYDQLLSTSRYLAETEFMLDNHAECAIYLNAYAKAYFNWIQNSSDGLSEEQINYMLEGSKFSMYLYPSLSTLSKRFYSENLLDSIFSNHILFNGSITRTIVRNKNIKPENDFLSAEKLKNIRPLVQSKLHADECIVEIIPFRKFGIMIPYIDYPIFSDSSSYLAIIISPDKKDIQAVVLNNGNDLDSIYFNRYKRYLTNTKLRDDIDWESYQHFWSDIDSVIGDRKVVYFSPGRVYNKLNIETFITPDGKYLSDKYDIRIIGSSLDILEPPGIEKKKIKNALLVGNPDFKSIPSASDYDTSLFASNQSKSDAYKYSTRSFDNTNVTTLPAAEKEVLTITELLNKYNYQTTTLTGKTAKESTIKSISSPSVLHLATHGFFAEDIEQNSDKSFWGMNKEQAIENPMLRSGVLLAGAENTIKGKYDPKLGTENGILTAYEVQQMDLDSTELVVLSACETGLGEIKNGEGVYGLQRAFRIAGAKSIIMSLWKVDDQATQLFMTSFYENWLSGKTKREAFKTAQEILKKNLRYSHPYYWGAFVMIGE